MISKLKILFTIVVLFCVRFSFAENYYWIGGSGNWSDITHWATQSGGAILHYRVPEADDNVIFDQNSFHSINCVVEINLGNAVCGDMDWTGALFNPKVISEDSINLRIYGSLRLIENMQFNYLGTIWFESVLPGRVINLAGHPVSNCISFQGNGGEWLLESDLTCNRVIYFSKGSINAQGYTINCNEFYSDYSNTRILNIENSIINVTRWTMNGTGLTLLANKSTINSSYSVYNHSGPPLYYWDVNFRGGRCQLVQSNIHCTFRNVIFDCAGGPDVCNVEGNCRIDTLYFNLKGRMRGSINGTDVISKLYATRHITLLGTNIFSKAHFYNDAYIGGSNQFDSLVFTPGNSYEFEINSTQKVIKSFSLEGTCSLPIRIYSSYIGVPAAIEKSEGTVSGHYLSLRDIHASGTQLPFKAFNSVDLGNNSNWSVETSAPKDLYWVNGTGNWNDPGHWDLQSGGGGGHCSPTEIDNVFFDNNSFNASNNEININLKNAVCHDMRWLNNSLTPRISGPDTSNIRIFGSLSLTTNMSLDFGGDFHFESDQEHETILSTGNVIKKDVWFTGKYGEWNLLDSLSLSGNIFFQRGSLFTRSFKVKCNVFSSEDSTTKKLSLGRSIFEVKSNWRLNGQKLKLKADSSLIRILNGSLYTFNGNNHHYYNVELFNGSGIDNSAYCQYNLVKAFQPGSNISGDCKIDSALMYGQGCHIYHHDTINYLLFAKRNGIIDGTHIVGECIFKSDGFFFGSNQFNKLRLTAAGSYYFEHNKEQTIIDNLDALGLCTGRIVLKSDHNDLQASIKKINGNVSCDYMIIRNINAVSTKPFIATNSVDLGNNSNWNFIQPNEKELYWVNGHGNWNDSLHWALSSGGKGGSCIPSPIDNVHFDKNSFTGTGNRVIVNITDAFCHDMDWSGSGYVPSFTGADTVNIRIYGSLRLIPEMKWDFNGYTCFESKNKGNEIFTAGNSFIQPIFFQGRKGSWTLLDPLHSTSTIFLKYGELNSNKNKITCYGFESIYGTERTLNLSSSVVDLHVWSIRGDSLLFINDDESLIISSHSVNTTFGNPVKYNDIEFYGSCSLNNNSTKAYYNNVTFKGTSTSNGNISGNCIIDSVNFEGNGSINDIDTVNYAYFKRFANINGQHYIHQAFLNENGRISGNNQFDTLKLTPANTYELQENKTQTVHEYFKIRGNNCFPIVLRSQKEGSLADVSSPQGVIVSGDFLDLRDINATGGAQFYAGLHSTDISNNFGWLFTNSPGYIYGFGNDTVLCMGESYLVTTENFNPESTTMFEWMDGSTLPYFLSKTEDTVSVKVYYAPGCVYPDTLFIQRNPSPEIAFPEEIRFCGADTIFLPQQKYPVTYSWQDGTTDSVYSVHQDGLYWVTATNDFGCSLTDSVNVVIKPLPFPNIGDSINIKWGETIQLDAGNPGAIYHWSTGETTQIITVGGDKVIWVTVEKDGCVVSDTIILHEYPRCIVDVPTAFSPNGDGQNDILYVYGENFVSFELMIFNRFGELVFSTSRQDLGWDGTWKGRLQGMEVYNYILKGTCVDGDMFFKKGNITLLQ